MLFAVENMTYNSYLLTEPIKSDHCRTLLGCAAPSSLCLASSAPVFWVSMLTKPRSSWKPQRSTWASVLWRASPSQWWEHSFITQRKVADPWLFVRPGRRLCIKTFDSYTHWVAKVESNEVFVLRYFLPLPFSGICTSHGEKREWGNLEMEKERLDLKARTAQWCFINCRFKACMWCLHLNLYVTCFDKLSSVFTLASVAWSSLLSAFPLTTANTTSDDLGLSMLQFVSAFQLHLSLLHFHFHAQSTLKEQDVVHFKHFVALFVKRWHAVLSHAV